MLALAMLTAARLKVFLIPSTTFSIRAVEVSVESLLDRDVKILLCCTKERCLVQRGTISVCPIGVMYLYQLCPHFLHHLSGFLLTMKQLGE